jgi:signal transduction histidine kinase
MLDVPILRSGHVAGVVCHEHVGAQRSFASWERLFAGSIGDLVSLALETERRVLAEQERTKLAESLGHAHRLESLGYLAAGVAHDLRNLLLVVSGNLGELSLTASTAGHAAAEDIRVAVRRSKELCDLLLTYAGRSELARTRVSLGALVVETERLLRARKPPNTTLEVEVAPDTPEVFADPTSVRQVVMNLVINAFDALSERGGHIDIHVGHGKPPAERVFDFRRGPGPWALLEVSDDGPGMSADTKARIFDPFFTTKPDGHGFGLASVFGIVRSHQGALGVESEPGLGTTLRVWLPAASA